MSAMLNIMLPSGTSGCLHFSTLDSLRPAFRGNESGFVTHYVESIKRGWPSMPLDGQPVEIFCTSMISLEPARRFSVIAALRVNNLGGGKRTLLLCER